jgi:hypothetical protein
MPREKERERKKDACHTHPQLLLFSDVAPFLLLYIIGLCQLPFYRLEIIVRVVDAAA